MTQAHAEPRKENAEVAPDQQWVDVSADPPDPPPREQWWRGHITRLMAGWTPAMSTSGRRRMAAALVGLLVLGMLVAVAVVMSSGGVEHETPPVLPVAAESSAPPVDKSIVVSVVGQVARPGLVTLSEGARVADALRETGGVVPGVDLGPLNLARRLADGEQIYVGVPVPPGADTASVATGQPGVAEKVDLNTATLATLDTLPGVGPVTAQRIVDWRTEHGRFDSVDQLREIDGIGPSRFAKLQEQVVVR